MERRKTKPKKIRYNMMRSIRIACIVVLHQRLSIFISKTFDKHYYFNKTLILPFALGQLLLTYMPLKVILLKQ